MTYSKKKMRFEAPSGAVLRLAGKEFPLSLSELLILMRSHTAAVSQPQKARLWERLAQHPAAAVRCEAVQSRLVSRDVLQHALHDKSCTVRLMADRYLRWCEWLPIDGEHADDASCAEIAYAGLTAPLCAGELGNFVWRLDKDDALLSEGILQEALMASPAWKSPDVRYTVLHTPGLSDAMVGKVWSSGTDDDRLSLLENADTRCRVTISEAELTDLVCRLRRAFTTVFWCNGADEALQRRIAAAVRGKFSYALQPEDEKRLDAVLAGETQAVDGEFERKVRRRGRAARVFAGGKPVVFHWFGYGLHLDNDGVSELFELFPQNLAGNNRTLFDVLSKCSEKFVREKAEYRVFYCGLMEIKPQSFSRRQDAEGTSIEAAGEFFYFDPAAVPVETALTYFGGDEARSFLHERFEESPDVRSYPAVRAIMASDSRMTRTAALSLMEGTDDRTDILLSANPAFWAQLTVQEILDFAGADTAMQYDCVIHTQDAQKRRALCETLLKTTDDPMVREIAGRLKDGESAQSLSGWFWDGNCPEFEPWWFADRTFCRR